MKISIILGTRPEIIKMSPIIRMCESQKIDYIVLHTGQHYSYDLDRVFFKDLKLPDPNYNLDIRSGTHAEETGRMLIGIEKILLDERPEIILVQGDTNTVLAGALAASKMQIKIGHVEAGLRSYDRNMPEEINRVLTDHISDFLFVPTEGARNNLIKEGLAEALIHVVGNTVVDAILQNLELSNRNSNALKRFNLEKGGYFLATVHRQENVDTEEKLRNILAALGMVYQKYGYPLIYPIHPRTKKRIDQFDISIPDGIELLNPLGYLDFLQIESGAKLILTDSGGIQEEGCILGVPCVTLRENTERPETLDVGSNILVGTDQTKILAGVDVMLNRSGEWHNPFGDGITAQKIIELICRGK